MGLRAFGVPLGAREFGQQIHLLPSQVDIPFKVEDQIAFLNPGTFAWRAADAHQTRLLQLRAEGGEVNRKFLAAVGFATVPPKVGQLSCRASGGEMKMGRCITLAQPRGEKTMGLRALEIAQPNFLGVHPGELKQFFPDQRALGAPQSSSILGGLIQGGFGALNTFLAAKFGGVGVGSPSPGPVQVPVGGAGFLQTAGGRNGGLIPAGGPIGMAVVSGAIIAAGGRIVGTLIQITRAGWARVPQLIKSAAVFLGLTVAFTDVGVPGFGGGGMAGELSNAQQNKIDRFTQMTGAGVPPGIAARAVGIGKRRRKGISAFELSGFRKISHMLSHVGMVPRGLRGARPRRHHHHK